MTNVSPDDVTIRPATPDDVDAAVAVWIASNDARAGRSATTPEIEAMMRDWIAVPDAILLIATDATDGPVIGMALAINSRADFGRGEPVPGLAHISLVFVTPGRWGQRIGARLLDALLTGIRARAYDRVQIWTHETNERALRLYASRGFVLTGDTRINALDETILRLERPVAGD